MTTLRGGLSQKIVFIHVPKCGGTSVDYAIRKQYPLFRKISFAGVNPAASLKAVSMINDKDPFEDDYYEVLKFREQILWYHLCHRNISYIHGHFNFSLKAYDSFKDQFKFITILRDPVERWISAFFYNNYRGENPWTVNKDIYEYLDSDIGKLQGHEYVKKFYGSIEKNIDFGSIDAIEKAKSNLEKFSLVGVLEKLEFFVEKFRDRFGIKLKIPLKNRGPKSSKYKGRLIRPDVKAKVEQFCQPDIEIYQHVKNRFLKG